MYEKKPNECCLFKSQRFQDAFEGSIDVGGKAYWINMWQKQGKNGVFYSVKLKEKQPKQEAPQQKDNEFNDSIPF